MAKEPGFPPPQNKEQTAYRTAQRPSAVESAGGMEPPPAKAVVVQRPEEQPAEYLDGSLRGRIESEHSARLGCALPISLLGGIFLLGAAIARIGL